MYTCFGSINLKFDSFLESIRFIRLLFILGYFNLTEENKYEDNLTNRGLNLRHSVLHAKFAKE